MHNDSYSDSSDENSSFDINNQFNNQSALIENMSKRICCIELINNNHIYIQYKETWTIEDLIKSIVSHKSFKQLYPEYKWQLNSKHHLPLFDLHLALYRQLKAETQTKVQFNIKLEDLRKLGILKNDKYPFFIFKDNRNLNNIIYTNEEEKLDSLRLILDSNFEYFAMYANYLPRINTLNVLNKHPQLEEFYQVSKQGLNKLTRYRLNPLISEDQNLDWFVYDDESMNFIVSFEKQQFKVISNIRFNNHHVYLEDIYPLVMINDEDMNNFYINITFLLTNDSHSELITRKFEIDTTTTMRHLFKMVNNKLKIMREAFVFELPTKILKVKSKNDYIFDLDAPLTQYVYINDCIKANVEAEYYVIDNPFYSNKKMINLEDEDNESNNSGSKKHRESSSRGVSIRDNKRLSSEFLTENLWKGILDIASFAPSVSENEIAKNIRMSVKHGSTSNNNTNTNNITFKGKKAPIITRRDLMGNIIIALNDSTKSSIDEYSKKIDESIFNNTINSINRSDDNFSVNESMMSEFSFLTSPSNISNNINNSNINNSSNRKYTNTLSHKKGSITKPFILDKAFALKKKVPNAGRPNIFTEEGFKSINLALMLNMTHEPIDLKTIKRPFSFIFRNAYINNFYNSYPKTKGKMIQDQFLSIIIFKFQIFTGNKKFSRKLKIVWRTNCKDNNPTFNKRIYFDLNYDSLPLFATMITKVKHVIYDKKLKETTKELIGWSNFKLFNHIKRLRTGAHKISLNTTPFSDDSYFSFYDCKDDTASAIFFEFDTFINHIINAPVQLENFKFKRGSVMINENDAKTIQDIKQKTPFDELNNYDKDILWANRYYLTQESIVFTKLLLCIDYKNPSHLIELEKLLFNANTLKPIQALKLLTGHYLHASIRKFAVKCLMQSTPEEILPYLIQLVQGLKYEMFHDSELAKYLLTMAINYPLTIGHCLFWNLRSEMYNQNVKQRFGLYLEVFLHQVGRKVARIYEAEACFIQKMNKVSLIPKDTQTTKEERKIRFNEELTKINKEMEENSAEISIPYDFKLRFKKIKVDKCRSMKSKKKPLWLVLENADPHGEDIIVLFKAGDDLRMDIVTLQLFKIMQNLWFTNKLKLKMSPYNVICTGYYQGMVEIVTNSETLAQIHIKEGGAMESFKKDSLKKWLNKNSVCSPEEVMENFMLTNVAYCLATFVLGIGDRHSDNIMLKTNGELFHIDFGHFLGHFKYKMGIKRERAPFVFTEQFQCVLGGEKGKYYKIFKEKFGYAYLILRANADMIVTVLRILLCTGIPELTEKSIKYLDTSLSLNNNPDQAIEFLHSKLTESLKSLSIQLNFWIHVLANK